MSSLAEKLDDVPLKMLKRDEGVDVQKLSEALKPVIGKALERAIGSAGFSKKEVAFVLSVSEAVVSRWCSGSETPQLAKLFAIKELRRPFLTALSESFGADISVTVRWKESA